MRITLHVVRVLLDTFGSGSGARSSHVSSLVLSHTVVSAGAAVVLSCARCTRTVHQYFSLYFEVHVLANATPYQVQLYLYLVCDMHTGHVALAVMGEYCTLIVYHYDDRRSSASHQVQDITVRLRGQPRLR